MAGSLGNLTVTLGVDARDFQSGLKDAQDSVGGFSEKVKGIGSTIAKGIQGSQTEILQAVRALDKQLGTDLNSLLSSAFLTLDLAEPFAGVIKGAIDKVAGNATVRAASAAVGTALGFIEMEARTLAAYGVGAITRASAAILAMQLPLAAAGTTVGAAIGTAMASGILTTLGPLALVAIGKAGSDAITQAGAGNPNGTGNQGFSPWNLLGQHAGAATAQGAQTGIAEHLADDVREGMTQSGLAVQFPKDMEKIAQDAADALAKQKIWYKSAQSITGDLASALQNNTDVVDAAMDKVTWAIDHPLELEQAKAKIQGALATLEYSKGLHSNAPEIVTVINQQEATLKLQWEQITGVAYTAGANAGSAWTLGWNRNFDPRVAFNDPGHDPGHKGPGGKAAGGPVSAYTPYMVGERGPELFVPKVSGMIIPHGATAAGSVTININGGDRAQLLQVLDQYVGGAFRGAHVRWSTS